VLSVDLAAIRRNYRRLSAQVAPAICAAVVKADGYGLGAIPVVQALLAEGCQIFYVAHLSEALALRDIVPRSAELIVLHGAVPGAETLFAEQGISPVLNSRAQIAAWSALSALRGERLAAHVQLDSGMARFGLSEADLLASIGTLDHIDLRSVMSHLACADTPDHAANAAQIAAFGRMRALLPPMPASLSASSGIFLGAGAHFDIVRPGAALYGVAPVPGMVSGLENVVRLDGVVLQIRNVPAGTAVGYGHTQTVEHPARLATIGVGYADGFRRTLSGKGAAYFGDVALPILGRISMDSTVVDATGTDLMPGMLVELIGPHRSVDDVARDAGTIGYEILTSLGRRFERRYLDG
jgi:alanine racemase